MADRTLQMTMLFDFYGDLLTAKQREYFDLYHNEDLSLSEIAENAGISKQGVRDIIVRAENTLVETENKTGIMHRFTEMREEISTALLYTEKIEQLAGDSEIASYASRIELILKNLKG